MAQHSGTVADPIPQRILYAKTDPQSGKKLIYTVASFGGGGSSDPALPQYEVVNSESSIDKQANKIYFLI